MENENQTDRSKPNPNFEEPNISKKHALMLERLSNLHATRLQTRPKSIDSSSPTESTQSFLTRFSQSKQSIETEISSLSNFPPSTNSTKPQFESISNSIAELEKLVAENSYFLPRYEVRSSIKSISDLKLMLEKLNYELVPKKKFSFKKKLTKKDPNNGKLIDSELGRKNNDSEEINYKDKINDSELGRKNDDSEDISYWDKLIDRENDSKDKVNDLELGCKTDESEKVNLRMLDSPGFRKKNGEVLMQEFKELETGEFTISELENCEVRLMGRVRALFIHKLRNCRVYVGPVLGSILIEEVEGCVFVLASHQMRIHCAKGCDFYLRVRSRPIIEDCSGVRFAPYCLEYKGIEDDLKDSGLYEETGSWQNVDDFRWLRAVQSPNWSIMPEDERVGTVTISNLGS